MLVDQRLVDQVLDEIRTSRQISKELRKKLAQQFALEKESQDKSVHDEGIEPS